MKSIKYQFYNQVLETVAVPLQRREEKIDRLIVEGR